MCKEGKTKDFEDRVLALLFTTSVTEGRLAGVSGTKVCLKYVGSEASSGTSQQRDKQMPESGSSHWVGVWPIINFPPRIQPMCLLGQTLYFSLFPPFLPSFLHFFLPSSLPPSLFLSLWWQEEGGWLWMGFPHVLSHSIKWQHALEHDARPSPRTAETPGAALMFSPCRSCRV